MTSLAFTWTPEILKVGPLTLPLLPPVGGDESKEGKTLSLFGGSLFFFFNLAVEELLLWDCFVFSCIFHFTGNSTWNFLQVKLVVCASFTTMWCCLVDFLTANMLTLTSMGLMCLYNVNNNNNNNK